MFDYVAHPPPVNSKGKRYSSSKRTNRLTNLLGSSGYMKRLRRAQKYTHVMAPCGVIAPVALNICEEAYSTAICGWCGVYNGSVGTSGVHYCIDRSCTGRAGSDRDGNAARNILMKV
jgi:hypothetical protein